MKLSVLESAPSGTHPSSSKAVPPKPPQDSNGSLVKQGFEPKIMEDISHLKYHSEGVSRGPGISQDLDS